MSGQDFMAPDGASLKRFDVTGFLELVAGWSIDVSLMVRGE